VKLVAKKELQQELRAALSRQTGKEEVIMQLIEWEVKEDDYQEQIV